ncbi:MAG: PAS domain S-box protein, partial [Verrucomicrobiales bacterium]
AVDIQCFDGSRKTILNSAVPVLGPEGALMGAVVFNQDITKRIEAEKTLKFSEARFRLLVDQLPFSLQILDPSGKTVKVNRAWQKLWGITLDQLEGYNLLADPQLKEKGILPYLERGFYGEMAEIPRVCYVPDRGEFKGKERWTRGFVYPVKNEDGTLREVVLMHEDITAQQEAEEALRASEERFRAIISQITAGIAQVDRQGKFTFVNDRFCQITGFTREELLQMTMQDITSREILEENMQKIQQLWHGAPPFVIEKQYTRKDGSKVWVNNSVAPVKGADGQIESVVSVTIDVNERKQVEEALRSSEERLRHATEASQLIVVEMDFLKKWVKCSPNAKEIWGISEGPVESFFDIIHPEDRPAMRAKANAMQRGERGYHAEYRVITPAGETRWLNSRGDIFLDSEGRPVSYAGVSVDVTERKRSEQALQETSERLRVATQTGKLGVWEWNIEGNEVIWTDSLYPMHGVTKDDFEPTGEGFTELIHPDDRERVGASIQGSLTSGAPYEISFRVVRRDGKVVWLFTNGIVLREEGKPVRMLGATTDITELKVAEEELRQSRERLQAALIGSGSGTFRWNIQTDELILDEQNNRLFGIPEGKQLEGFKHFFEILHPDDHGPFLDEIARCKKGSDFELEYRVIWPDGSVHWIFDKGKTFLDPKGNPIYMAGSCVDITKRKEAEQQLAQTTAILKAISDNSPDLVYAKDTEGRLIIANPALCGFLNKKADQLLGKNELQWGGDTAETRAIMGVDQQVLNGRRTMVVEEKLTGADGASRVFLSAKACWFDASGEVIGLIGISRDITERKQAEEALQTTADRLSLALAAGKLGDWSWDAATDVVDCSAQAAEIFGLPPGPSITWTQMQELLHEEDREMARYAVEKAIREQSRYEATYRVVCKDGSEVWVAAFGLAQYAANGRPVAMLGVIQDITDRKTTELALANAQHELKLHAATLEKIVLERTARLRDTVAELEHFSYTITHDMRAPLRTMQGFAQIIKDEYGHKLDAFGADYLRRIIDSAIRMDNLITDSLNYAKTVQTELTLEPLDVSALLRGIVESYPQFQWPRAEIEVAATTPLVLANQAGLTQCFSNLLGNAVKFVEAGKTPKVKVWAEERDAKVRFWVEDNGIGIPLDQQKKVFTMFQRMTSEFEGTGVGLALVRKVVEKMRGKVGFESEEGKGSRFWVELARAGERS